MPWITKEGRTVEEAQGAAIAEAGRPESDLDIEVVNEGAKGLFGLGGEPAVVRVRPKDEATDYRSAFQSDVNRVRPDDSAPSAPRDEATDEDDPYTHTETFVETDAGVAEEDVDGDEKRPLSERQEEAAQLGVEIVRGILERMEIEGEINTRIAGGTVYIEVFGDEMGILIGRSGTTLEALQELVRAGIQRRLKTRQAVVVDVESYWERRRKPQRRESGGGERRGNGGGRRRGGRGRSGGGRSRDPNRREPEGERADEPDGNRA
jgi:spoIIIJ-associated protein